MQPTPQFIQARFQTVAHRERVDWIVLHSTEGACVAGKALQGAQEAANGERQASAHYFVDPATIIQCVHEYNVAWHCPCANRRGIGIEQCGSGLGELVPITNWQSPEAQAMLRLSAALVIEIAARWNIPLVLLQPTDILANKRGIFGHVDATEAFQTPGGHRDPGSSFPWQQYMALLAGGERPAPTER